MGPRDINRRGCRGRSSRCFNPAGDFFHFVLQLCTRVGPPAQRVVVLVNRQSYPFYPFNPFITLAFCYFGSR